LTTPKGDKSPFWKGEIKKRCLNCGKIFHSFPFLKQKYCSHKCANSKNRIYHLDENFFQEIRTENQAYWLGFVLADGCIGANKSLDITLKIQDRNHLEKFLRDIKAKNPLKDSTTKTKIKIFSVKLIRNLKKFNMVSPRPKNVGLPKISKKLFPHLIRGIFDGDGCLIFNKINRKNKKSEFYYSSFSISNSSRILLSDIQIILMKNCQLERTKLIKRSGGYELIYGGRLQTRRIMSFLYSNAHIYLERKFKIFEDLMNYSPKIRKRDWHGRFTNS